MKKIVVIILVTCMKSAAAQTDTFDIASFTAPAGWQRTDSNGIVLLQDEQTKDGMLTAFCQIFLFPSKAAGTNATKNFNTEWAGRVAGPTGSKTKPILQTEKTPDGWTVITGHANITQQGLTYACMLVTASGYNKVMSFMVNTAGGDYLPAITTFFDKLELNASLKKNVNPVSIAGNTDIYEYNPPARWTRQNTNDYILWSQTSDPGYGCLISILPLQKGSANIEADVKKMFTQLYPGWQFRYTGEQKDELTKGYTSQGLEFCRLTASMQKQRPDGYYYDYEKGDVLAISTGNKVAVIISRHNRGEMTCFCDHQYEYWPNFFNSFRIKNATPASHHDTNIAQRIIGSWQSMGGSALVRYIFAANKHYQFIGAYSTVSRIDRYTIEQRISGFKGDGTYTIKGNQIIFTKDGSAPETSYYRIEQLNMGSTGWTDRLYIRGASSVDGKEFEVSYEKEK